MQTICSSLYILTRRGNILQQQINSDRYVLTHTSGRALVGGLPLGTATVTWGGHWELQVRSGPSGLQVWASAPLPCPLSIYISLFLASAEFLCLEKAPACCDFWLPENPVGIHLLTICLQSIGLRSDMHKRHLIESIDSAT